MINEAISCIVSELNATPPGIDTAAGNISEIGTGNNTSNADRQIIVSLVNIEENRMSRDPINYARVGTGMVTKNPPVHLNLTLLFTALKSDTVYTTALENLQRVIQFFQSKYVFDHTNSTSLDPAIEKLTLEMYSISIEQLNQLWAILGGKYQPSVLYKMRMVTIDSVTDQPADLVRVIEANYNLKE
jgi:hypothetical protein